MVIRKVDFLPFAPNPDSNLITQETWEALSTVQVGFVEGKASAKITNKALRQATSISAAFAQTISKYADVDVLDNGNLTKIAEDFKTAIFNIAATTVQDNILDFKYAKRIMYTTAQNYRDLVILLMKVAPTASGDSGKKSANICGTLSFFRGGMRTGNRLEVIDLSLQTAWTGNRSNFVSCIHKSESWKFRVKKCTYNGEEWFCLANTEFNIQNFDGSFVGVSHFEDSAERANFLKIIPYIEKPASGGANVILNTEINNSLTDIDPTFFRPLSNENGNAYYSPDNKPTPSDLGSMYKELPLPDFHAPLNDDLKILHGYGDYDTIEINSHVIDLATKSVNMGRASTATYIDKCGKLRKADINEPRFEKDGILTEGRGININLNSVSMSGWATYQGNTFTDTGTVDSIGNKIWEWAYVAPPMANNSVVLQKPQGDLKPNTTYTASCFIKGSTDAYVEVFMADGMTRGKYEIQELSDGWRRESLTFTTGTGAGAWIRIQVRNPTVAKNIFLAGYQLEEGPRPTSYIPTEAAEAVRGGEVTYVDYAQNLPGTGKDVTIAFETDLKQTNFGTTPSFVGIGIDKIPVRYWLRATLEPNGGITLWAGARNDYDSSKIKDKNIVVLCRRGDLSVTALNGEIKQTAVLRDTEGGCITLQTGHVRNLRIWHRAFSDEEIKWIR